MTGRSDAARRRGGIGGTLGLATALLLGSGGAAVASPPRSYALDPAAKGGQDMTGPYDVVPDWLQDISTLPGNSGWTYGAAQSVFAESPDRIIMLFRGELPKVDLTAPRPRQALSNFGPSFLFPVGRLPVRDATASSLPGTPPSGSAPGRPTEAWVGTVGVDAKWENCIVVADRNGRIVERWTQWDKILQRPHYVTINPYDPEKNVWVVDDNMHAIYVFSNDGKRLIRTLGTPGVPGDDATHFNRPTYIAWLPDGSMFVADGYAGTRVVKFDKDGKFLLQWGQKGNPPNETRPGYMNNVHGVAVDPKTRRVFVNDRDNHRIQVFDENGRFLDSWKVGGNGTDIHLLYIGADRSLWAFDRGSSRMLKYDLDGHYLYGWGSFGTFAGGFWGVHGISIDQLGNFYVAEVDTGRVQKFTPRPRVDPWFLVGKPVRGAWK